MSSLVARTRAARALSWAAVDHGMSSLSNLLVTLAVARGGGLEGMGRFAVAGAVYYVAIGLQRALVSDPLLVTRRRCEPGGNEERAALGCCLAVGLVAGVLSVTAGTAIGYPELTALAGWLPLMMLQDGLRFVAFRRLASRTAALIDLAWVGASALAWPLAAAGSPARAVFLWGAGAAISSVVGLALLRVAPAGPATAVEWWRADAGRFAIALGGDAALGSSATQASLMVIGGVLGPRALGAVRAAQVVVAPAILLLTAFGAFALPRFALRAQQIRTKDAVRASAVALALVAPVVVVAALRSDAVGRLLFGSDTPVQRSILAGLLVGTVAAAAAQGVVLLLKVTRRGPVLLGARVAAASTLLGMVVVLATTRRTEWLGWAFAGQSTAYLATASIILVARGPQSADRGHEPLDEDPLRVSGLEDAAHRPAGELPPRE